GGQQVAELVVDQRGYRLRVGAGGAGNGDGVGIGDRLVADTAFLHGRRVGRLGDGDRGPDVAVGDRGRGAGGGRVVLVVMGVDRDVVNVGGAGIADGKSLAGGEGDRGARSEHSATAVGDGKGREQVAQLVVEQRRYRL